MKDSPTTEAVERLLAEGLDHYAARREEEAIAAWQRVLMLAPDHPQALDYLRAAGAEPEPRPLAPVIDLEERRPKDANAWRNQVVEAVRERRYEQALEILEAAREQNPGDPSVGKSISNLKSKLVVVYAEQLGSLDTVPTPAKDWGTKDPEALAVLGFVDGVCSYDEILDASPLGRFRSLRVLARHFGGTTRMDPARREEEFQKQFNAAIAASLAGRYEQALELFQRCDVLKPGDPRVALNVQRIAGRSQR
ncbi:MAG: hypothetical protein R3B13_28200 [Polyangiaceae bacterium]